ncbi:MAG: hypothetical protein JNL72_05450 [Flavipsychrobacter sp.]|nr:hypothetical protein [Flavipsychrobacter sp.]
MSQVRADSSLTQLILEQLKNGISKDHIAATLKDQGHEDYFVKELIRETVKLRDAQARSQGLTLIVIGAVLCFFSCVITLFSSAGSQSFSFVLYGLTTAGILLIFAGFTKVF